MRKAALCLGLCLLLTACGPAQPAGEGTASPTPSTQAPATPAPSPTQGPLITGAPGSEGPSPEAPTARTPEPSPSEEPREPYDFTQPVPESEAVDEDYFADACFIGDSRVDGFRLWSGLTQGDFIVHTGLKIFDIYDRNVKYNGQEMLVLDALALKQYKKVYISLGVNELGYHNDQAYYDTYAKVVDDIRALEPDAVLYIQLLIPVNSKKCAETGQADYVENGKIATYNELLRKLGEEKKVAILDPAEAMVDETGEPPYDMTADGVHFQRSGYEAWYEYLKTHTIEKEDLE